MHFNLPTKIILMLQVVLCFALISTGFLSYLKMEKMVESTVASRFSIALHALGGEFEDAVGLGVSLTALPDTGRMFQGALARDSRITGITLFAPSGDVIGSAGRAAVSGHVAPEWLTAFQRDAKNRKMANVEIGDASILLLPVPDPFGGIAGGLALTFSLREVRSGVRAAVPALLISNGINLVVGFLVTLLVVWLVLRPIQRGLQRATRCVATLGLGERPTVTAEIADFAPGLDQFIESIAAIQALDPRKGDPLTGDPVVGRY
jgi:hypothetical protein